jgi:hypothetical protein
LTFLVEKKWMARIFFKLKSDMRNRRTWFSSILIFAILPSTFGLAPTKAPFLVGRFTDMTHVNGSFTSTPSHLITNMTLTSSKANFLHDIDAEYMGYSLGRVSLSTLTASYNALTDPVGTFYWASILHKYGFANVKKIKWALDNIVVMPNGLPKTGVDKPFNKDYFAPESNYLLYAYNYSKWYNYHAEKYNLTKAYNTAKTAIDSRGCPVLWIYNDSLASNLYGGSNSRLFEADQNIEMFTTFYQLGVSGALSEAEKWWNWVNVNLWTGTHYKYCVSGYPGINNSFVWDFPGLVQAIKRVHYYDSKVGNYSRLIQSIEAYYLQNSWASPIWTYNGKPYYMVEHLSILNSNKTINQRRLSGTEMAYAAMYGDFAAFNSTYKTALTNFFVGTPAYHPAWQMLYSSVAGCFDADSGKFRFDSTGSPSDDATALACNMMLLAGTVPVTAQLAVPVQNLGLGFLYNIIDQNIFNINTTSRQETLGIAQPGVIKFLFNQTTSYNFTSSGLFRVTFGVDWNSISSITRMGNLPDRIYTQTATPYTPRIPEFPPVILLPLFMMMTLLAIIVYMRKRPSTQARKEQGNQRTYHEEESHTLEEEITETSFRPLRYCVILFPTEKVDVANKLRPRKKKEETEAYQIFLTHLCLGTLRAGAIFR